MKLTLLGWAVLITLIACIFKADASVNTITNGSAFSTWRTQINEGILQSNTNVLDIVATSNAFVSADSGITSAYIAADTVVSNAYVAADTVVSNAYVAADTSLSSTLTSAYQSADTTVSNTLAAVDTILAATNVTQNTRLDALEAGGGIPAGSITETELNTSVNTSLDLADSAVQPSDSVTTLSDVSNAGSGAIITSVERSNLGTAVQPATLTSATNANYTLITSEYIAADTVVSNALASQISAGSVYYPINPSELLCAYTVDGVYSNDWWGSYSLTNNGNVPIQFDATNGNYFAFDYTGTYPVYTVSDLSIATNFSAIVKFNVPSSVTGDEYVLTCFDGSKGFEMYYHNSTASFWVSFDGSGIQLSKTSVSEDVWHVAVLTVEGTATKLYFDGTLADTYTIASPLSWSEKLVIGGRDQLDSEADTSYVNDVYVFDRVLNQAEISRLNTLEMAGQYGVLGIRRP